MAALLQITRKLSTTPLIEIQSATFAERYATGVLTLAGTLRPDATTLVVIHTGDFREGYERGRRDYFTRSEELVHTEDELLDLLRGRAQDNLYLAREQDTLRWAVGCTVGELSGRLFPP